MMKVGGEAKTQEFRKMLHQFRELDELAFSDLIFSKLTGVPQWGLSNSPMSAWQAGSLFHPSVGSRGWPVGLTLVGHGPSCPLGGVIHGLFLAT